MVFLIIFFICGWYVGLFFQTFFMHRYAAHSMFKMSPFWQKVFYFGSWLTQGSSYLSPYAYAILHRLHHDKTDTEEDPHSPSFSKNIFTMMYKTWREFNDILHGRVFIEPKYKKNIPHWDWFDKMASSDVNKLFWVLIYLAVYIGAFVAYDISLWYLFIAIPMFMGQCLMSPIHGAIINYFAHKYGYRNFDVDNTSTNLLRVDFLMMGESYHNNHHKLVKPNFGYLWYEIDPVWPIIWTLDKLHVIRLNKTA